MAEEPAAFKIVWTDPALDDLSEIVRYVAADDPSAAERLGQAFLNQVSLLSNFPHLGAPYRRRKHPEVRETPCRGYRIFYRVLEQSRTVEVLRVWHGARDEPGQRLFSP